MVSRKLAQRTNAWLIRVDFFYIHSCVNGLCFGYFQIFPERSPFDLKITLTLTPFPYVRRLLDLRVFVLQHSAKNTPTPIYYTCRTVHHIITVVCTVNTVWYYTFVE